MIFLDDYKNICRRIWEGYKTYAFGAAVIRKGFESFGATIDSNDSMHFNSIFFRRGESILEHQAKTAWLASVFTSNFPDFFGSKAVFRLAQSDWAIITTALCHDVGETEIGDILDDGNRLHDAKDEAELNVYKSFIKAYSYADQARLLDLFMAFQDKNSNPGRALYALDKTEAVLTNLILEKYGIKGDLSRKKNPTGRDLFYAEVTGSKLASDIWGSQMSSRLKNFPSAISEPVFTLLKVASYDIRGEEFFWLPEKTPHHPSKSPN